MVEMGSNVLHVGFLIMVLQHLACPAALCGDTSITEVQVQVGENVSMSCLFPAHNLKKSPNIRWNYQSQDNNTTNTNLYKFKDGVENGSGYWPHFNARVRVNTTGLTHGDATLHLTGVMASDQGKYHCWVGLGFDCVSVEVQLWVTDRPPILEPVCGLAAACFPGLVLSLAATLTLCM